MTLADLSDGHSDAEVRAIWGYLRAAEAAESLNVPSRRNIDLIGILWSAVKGIDVPRMTREWESLIMSCKHAEEDEEDAQNTFYGSEAQVNAFLGTGIALLALLKTAKDDLVDFHSPAVFAQKRKIKAFGSNPRVGSASRRVVGLA